MSKPKYRMLRDDRVRRVGTTARRETLGDLQHDGGMRPYHDLVRDLRDGSVEQRCGGGTRIIRKRTPE